MPLQTTVALVRGARDAGTAAVAFNAIGLEHAEAIVAGAEASGSGAIIQVSENAVRFRGAIEPLAAALVALAERATVPIALHLDHATELELCRRAAAAGFSSVMFDAAAEDDAANAAATAKAVDWARGEGIAVEGELGEIAGKPGAKADPLTDPIAAADYVAATGVELLAVAVGSAHKMTDATARLDLERIAQLREAVEVPLVLHGSSGVADAHLREAVAAGMTKINVGTRVTLAFSRAVRDALAASAAAAGEERLPDPRELLAPARAAMAAEVEALLRALA
jgi:fructose-bisphosphate aldolase class II